jgi:hypothetical protein
MDNSLKWLLGDIIDYAANQQDIIVKTPTIMLSARTTGFFISWVLIYKKKTLSIIGEIGDTDTVFYSMRNFICDMDRECNESDNS